MKGQKIVGLIGPGKGPRLSVPDGKMASAHVAGLKSGSVLVRSYPRDAHLLRNPEAFEEIISKDNNTVLFFGKPPAWIEFEYEGTCQVICTVRVA
jgi:hypothetical protein